VKKIVNELINCSIENADVYRWKDATWLIFTDETRWVVELTDKGTLWYNYKFFKDVFKYVSINVGTEMDGYIIQWANDFFYKDCVHRSAAYPRDKDRTKTPNVVNNGIKNLSGTRTLGEHYVEMVVERGKNHGDEFEWHTRAVINKGVKEVSNSMNLEPKPEFVEEVVNKGIKEVNQSDSIHRQRRAENLIPRIIKNVKPNRVTVHDEKMDRFYYSTDCAGNNTEIFRIIEEGVKEVKRSLMYSNSDVEYIVKKVKPNIEYSKQSGVFHPDCVANHVKIEKVIDEGVKEIKPSIWTTKRGVDIHDLMCSGNTTDISTIVKSGVKNIYPDQMSGPDGYNWSNEFEADKVIEGGMKVIPLPDVSGELRGYSDYYNTKEDRTKPHTEYVKDAIKGGTKL
jgi:hypothetical protein